MEHISLPIGMLPLIAIYDRNLKCLAFPRNYFEPWCAVDALEIETVLRKFNPCEQNLEISSPSLTSHGKLGLLTQLRGEGQ